MDIAALVIALIALGISGASVMYARRQTRIAQRALELTEEEAARYPAPWRLEHTEGDRWYALVNDGSEPVFDVVIEVPGSVLVGGNLEYTSIPAGSAASFMLVVPWQSQARNISASWSREPGGERRDWMGLFPAKSS